MYRVKTTGFTGTHIQSEDNRMHSNIYSRWRQQNALEYICRVKTTGFTGMHIQSEDNRMHWNTYTEWRELDVLNYVYRLTTRCSAVLVQSKDNSLHWNKCHWEEGTWTCKQTVDKRTTIILTSLMLRCSATGDSLCCAIVLHVVTQCYVIMMMYYVLR
jgi:uncharacterized C2H2 Zn-finger protein